MLWSRGTERPGHFRLDHVTQSVCPFCLQTIAYSSRSEVLSIAENAHKCPRLLPKTKPNLLLRPDAELKKS
jgi:hypothetical protein